MSSNVEGSYKRSATLGMAIGWGNLNGAVTTNAVRDLCPEVLTYSRWLSARSTEPAISHGTDLAMASL